LLVHGGSREAGLLHPRAALFDFFKALAGFGESLGWKHVSIHRYVFNGG
jgi:hypothetical protein